MVRVGRISLSCYVRYLVSGRLVGFCSRNGKFG